MIKANELRVGNYFYLNTIDENCHPVKILTQANSMFIRDCEHYGEKWTGDPIPLSEDILLRLEGFECTYKSDIHSVYSLGDGTIGYYFWYGTGNNYLSIAGTKFICKTLHQLQNVIFDLKATELTLT